MITSFFYKLSVIILGLFDWLPTWNFSDTFFTGFDTWLGFMYRLNPLFPVWSMFKAILMVLSYFVIVRIWNLFSDFLALLRGSGNPKI